jgi:hypothetical protein
MYIIGQVVSISIMIYKGVLVELYWSRDPTQSWSTVYSMLYGGNKLLRIGVYGIAHILMASGLGMLALSTVLSIRRGVRKNKSQ